MALDATTQADITALTTQAAANSAGIKAAIAGIQQLQLQIESGNGITGASAAAATGPTTTYVALFTDCDR